MVFFGHRDERDLAGTGRKEVNSKIRSNSSSYGFLTGEPHDSKIRKIKRSKFDAALKNELGHTPPTVMSDTS
jgi:hypothetical protein